jgi:putative sigma-54 modulation protein
MKDHLRDKLAKLEKYASRLVESHVVLKKEKYIYVAEVTLAAKNLRAYGEGRSKENIFSAIDESCARVEKQLKKFREKIKKHHGKIEKVGLLPETSGQDDSSSASEAGDAPRIIKDKSSFWKPMMPEEASMQLKLTGDHFIAFLNPKNERLCVIYKRQDGNHGLIEP